MAMTANVGSHAFCFVLIGFLFIPGSIAAGQGMKGFVEK
jgi:hypothetical protein